MKNSLPSIPKTLRKPILTTICINYVSSNFISTLIWTRNKRDVSCTYKHVPIKVGHLSTAELCRHYTFKKNQCPCTHINSGLRDESQLTICLLEIICVYPAKRMSHATDKEGRSHARKPHGIFMVPVATSIREAWQYWQNPRIYCIFVLDMSVRYTCLLI